MASGRDFELVLGCAHWNEALGNSHLITTLLNECQKRKASSLPAAQEILLRLGRIKLDEDSASDGENGSQDEGSEADKRQGSLSGRIIIKGGSAERGGFGSVVKGRHPQHGAVALKSLHDEGDGAEKVSSLVGAKSCIPVQMISFAHTALIDRSGVLEEVMHPLPSQHSCLPGHIQAAWTLVFGFSLAGKRLSFPICPKSPRGGSDTVGMFDTMLSARELGS